MGGSGAWFAWSLEGAPWAAPTSQNSDLRHARDGQRERTTAIERETGHIIRRVFVVRPRGGVKRLATLHATEAAIPRTVA
ncbi:MAG: hypothetical protein ACHQCI_06900, partial [Solirubrobacterales bacterium]